MINKNKEVQGEINSNTKSSNQGVKSDNEHQKQEKDKENGMNSSKNNILDQKQKPKNTLQPSNSQK